MEARVKSDARYNRYQLFSGREFIKQEWRTVPVEFEGLALKESLLEIRDAEIVVESKPIESPVEKTEPPAEVEKTPGKKAGRPRTHAGGIQ